MDYYFQILVRVLCVQEVMLKIWKRLLGHIVVCLYDMIKSTTSESYEILYELLVEVYILLCVLGDGRWEKRDKI